MIRGVGSDSPFPPSTLISSEDRAVILPTVSPTSTFSRKTRIEVVRYTPGGDYAVVTRPLYMSVEDALEEARKLKNRELKLVAASVVADKLSGFQYLVEAFDREVDAIEVDLGLFYAIYGFRRGFESYAIDIVEELIPYSKVPLIVKLAPSMPLNRDLIYELGRAGVSRVVYSTRPVYVVGSEIFRVHSTHLSMIYSRLWRRLAGKNFTIPSMLASDIAYPNSGFEAVLLDVSIIMEKLEFGGHVKNAFPEKWLYVPEGLYPAIKGLRECASTCPYNAFSDKSNEIVIADKNLCDMCGLCISLCGSNVTLAKELTPK